MSLHRGPGSIVGYGVAVVGDEIIPFHNLVTTVGDAYYGAMAIAGVSPATPSAPTLMTGMKLGTGVTAAAKSGAGAALGTYLSGSNATFDSTYPQGAAVGGDSGYTVTYSATWAAGTATEDAISEVVIVNDAATDATSTAANTLSRAVLDPVANKGATQALTIIWNHTFLGS